MIVICGPTSVGKTGIALRLAKELNLQIISADSRQVYKEFDVGTGKLPIDSDAKIEKRQTYWEIDGVRVYGYDVVDPHQIYSAGKFAEDFEIYKNEIISNGSKPLLVGGTGLYIDSVLYGFDQYPTADWGLRDELEKLSLDELQQRIDSEILSGMNNSDRNNKRRLIRKIEIEKHGKTNFLEKKSTNNKIIFLQSGNQFLYDRVDRWIETIWLDLLEEVKLLISKGYENTSPMNGIIYKTLIESMDENAKTKIKYDLHSYIRRQLTWFRRYKDAEIIDVSDKNAYNVVKSIVIRNLENGR